MFSSRDGKGIKDAGRDGTEGVTTQSENSKGELTALERLPAETKSIVMSHADRAGL
jgi:hypothetical protein